MPIRDPRKALCMGVVFAVSTVIPGKIQHLAYHLKTINHFGTDGFLDHGLQLLGCFLVISVLIWTEERTTRKTRLLTAYPPHSELAVSAHIAGLITGTLLILL